MAAVHHFEFKAMACACDISVGLQPEQDQAWAQAQAQKAIAEVLRIEAKYSRYQSQSIVSQINAAAGRHPVELDPETQSLIDFADHMHTQSEGLFDITSGVYRQIWDFQKAQCPTPEQIGAIRPLVGWTQVQREGTQLFLPRQGMQIDFGGLGKEYAADRAALVLRNLGVQHALVNLGGDIASVGTKSDGQHWAAGIRHPRDATQIMASLQLFGQALATSGDYERYFELAGQRYCHIIDPFTGWPVQHFRSVSVVAPSCLLAGAVGTTIMLKQALATPEWLEQLNLPVLWMDTSGEVRMLTADAVSRTQMPVKPA
jgi:thiamine biosynthesis lipoprotein